MSLEQIKSQLLTIFAVKGGDNSGFMPLIYSIIMLTLLDHVMRSIPLISVWISEVAKKFLTKHVKQPLLSPEVTARIIFERFYVNKRDDNVADAVLDYICKQDCVVDLVFNNFYLANKESCFDLTSNLKVRILAKEFKEENLVFLKFEVFSYTWTLSQLKTWVSTIERDFQAEKKNQFGSKRYFFDEIREEKDPRFPQPTPPYLFFAMTEFMTNKSLSNIYGHHVDNLKTRVDLFVKKPEWYEKRGVPHTLGILLHGPPGTGKTSLIKAIAKDTKRHIFNIHLHKDTTPDQLNDLFFNESVKLKSSSGTLTTVIVPANQRIYVIEDIDCLSEVVLDRKETPPLPVSPPSSPRKDKPQKEPFDPYSCGGYVPGSPPKKKSCSKEKEKPKLTLSFLLNLFDGVLETPGRILIMTSNYPERLDKALIRPGRIDINLHLTYCTNDLVSNMYEGFFTLTREFKNIEDKKVTPAKIQEILCNNFNDPEKAYREICDL